MRIDLGYELVYVICNDEQITRWSWFGLPRERSNKLVPTRALDGLVMSSEDPAGDGTSCGTSVEVLVPKASPAVPCTILVGDTSCPIGEVT